MFLTLHFALLRRPLAVWLAVLIALFGALAPTLSHALVLARGGTSAWTEVCTSTGTRWVLLGPTQNAAPPPGDAVASVDDDPPQTSAASPQPPQAALSLDHCPFCLLAADRFAPPPHTGVPLFAMTGEAEVPTIRLTFYVPEPLALTPPSRGPPDLF